MILKSLKYLAVMIMVLLLTILIIPFIILIELLYLVIDLVSTLIGIPYKLFLLLSRLMGERFNLRVKSFENQYCNWLDSFHEKSGLIKDSEFEKE